VWTSVFVDVGLYSGLRKIFWASEALFDFSILDVGSQVCCNLSFSKLMSVRWLIAINSFNLGFGEN
jgi:hypothetical protein